MLLDFLTPEFLAIVGYNLPALITMVIGMVLATTMRQRHPGAARWTQLGFAWLFGSAIVSIAWHTIGVPHLIPNDVGTEFLTYVALSFVESFGYVCFLIALSAASRPYRPRAYLDDFADEDDRLENP